MTKDINPTTNSNIDNLLTEFEASSSQQKHVLMQLASALMQNVSSISLSAEAEAKKTDQLRLKFDALLRQFESITSQFIAEHVEKQWIKELAETCEALQAEVTRKEDEPNPEMLALIDKIERRLADADISWICPDIGADFNSKCHKPVETQTTPDQSIHGQIAQVFCKGFARNGHPLKHARVSVFRYQPTAA